MNLINKFLWHYWWVVLFVAIGMLFGSLFTWAIVDGGWIKDCNTMGQHRTLSVVYTCSLKEKAK